MPKRGSATDPAGTLALKDAGADSVAGAGLPAYAWVILAITTLVQSSATISTQAISPLAPFFQDDLGISRAQVGLLATAVFAGTLLAMPFGGRVGDLFGSRRMFVGGLLGIAVCAVLAAFAGQYLLLVVALLLTGLGSGAAIPSTTRAVMDWFPQRIRGLTMSIKQTGLPLAGATAGLLMPWIGLNWGWRGGLLAIAGLALTMAVVSLAGYREPVRGTGPVHSSLRRPGGALDLCRDPNFIRLSLSSAVFSVVHISTGTFLVLFLSESVGLAVVAAGSLFALTQISAVVSRIGWGLLSDFALGGRRKPILLVIAMGTLLAVVALSRISPDTPTWALTTLIVVLGATVFGWNGINMTFVAEIAGRERSATAAGLNQAITILGTLAGPPIFGLIVDRTQSYALAFQILAGLMVLAIVLVALVRTNLVAPPVPTSPAGR